MPEPLHPDEELAIARGVKQNPAAIRDLYRAYFPRIYAYVAYRVATRQDAEDLTSDIFIRILEAAGRFEYRGVGSLSGWVFRIASSVVNQHYRYGQRREFTSLDEQADFLQSAELSPDEALTRQERFARLQAAVQALTPRRQEIVTLRFMAGLRNQEIAAALGLDERTVASHLCRALEDLQQIFQEEGVLYE